MIHSLVQERLTVHAMQESTRCLHSTRLPYESLTASRIRVWGQLKFQNAAGINRSWKLGSRTPLYHPGGAVCTGFKETTGEHLTRSNFQPFCCFWWGSAGTHGCNNRRSPAVLLRSAGGQCSLHIRIAMKFQENCISLGFLRPSECM